MGPRSTVVHLTLRERLIYQIVRPARYRLAVAGGGLARLGLPLPSGLRGRLGAMMKASERHDRDRRRAPATRLDPALVDALTRDDSHVTMNSIDDASVRAELEKVSRARWPYRPNLAYHDCAEVLRSDPATRSAVNIGAGIDLVFYSLARQFPSVEFASIDFSKRVLRRLPHIFGDVPTNWRGVSGYPLDLLADRRIGRDLVLMTGVASMLTHHEYRGYLAACADARWIVLSDVWYPPIGRLSLRPTRPEDVPADRAPLVGGAEGGSYLHNHPALLAEAGFDVVDSELCAGPTSQLVRLIARRKGLNA